MKHIDFEFNGATYALSFTAEAMFAVYDKFGYTHDIIGATKIEEPTGEGWTNLCWLAALMASQGELQRRNWGYDPAPMVTVEQLRTGLMAAESLRLKQAVMEALAQGFERSIPDDSDQEVNLVLLEREEAEKKARAAAASALHSWLQRLSASISARKKH